MGGPILDMKKGLWYRSSGSSAIMNIANIQVCHSLNLVTGAAIGGGIGGGESKTVNSQWGLEALNSLPGFLAGGDVGGIGGTVGMGQAISYEGILIQHEVVTSLRRILEGIEITPESLALDLFEKEGPGGKFIGYRHTLKWYLKEHVPPVLFDKEVWQKWEEMGRKDIVDRAHEKVVEILDTHEVESLPKDVLEEIHAYQKEYRKSVETGIFVPGKPPL
jgi:trimethylamine--corrinoid protein Co-methyltransferase